MSGIVITKVIHEHHKIDITRTGYGPSIGELIDEHLMKSIANGSKVQTVAVEFTDAEWSTFVEDNSPKEAVATSRPDNGHQTKQFGSKKPNI